MRVTKRQLERIIRESLNEQVGSEPSPDNLKRAYELVSKVSPLLMQLYGTLEIIADETGDPKWRDAAYAVEDADDQFGKAASVIMGLLEWPD